MINQNPIINRQEFFVLQRTKRLSFQPIGRKAATNSLESKPINQQATINLNLSDTSIRSEPISSNPYPINRQHKSKVIYRNFNHPKLIASSARKKTLNHSLKQINYR